MLAVVYPATKMFTYGGGATLRRAVKGGKENSPWNLKILLGIGRLGKFSGRQEVIKLKFFGKFEIL